MIFTRLVLYLQNTLLIEERRVTFGNDIIYRKKRIVLMIDSGINELLLPVNEVNQLLTTLSKNMTIFFFLFGKHK